MKQLSTNEIRKIWLDFFEEKGHFIDTSKSLVPVDDSSLLFINSGVATLKKYFDGSQTPPNNRIATAQKSIRTNDIENVGITSRHHTLFEMLGNFSIGDYFKEEVINWAMEILTDPKWYGFDLEKLYFTVHTNDDDAYNYWIKEGVKAEKIIKLEENFWEIGPGPGGPNTEIFYDRGSKFDSRNPKELIKDDIENNRVIEIWNIVFSQYNCNPGIVPISEYEELPQKNIDTGLGLERMASVMQDVDSNFETDNFIAIINHLNEITGVPYQSQIIAYRVISDHIRALTFAIADGVLPSNAGRGYVIRRILRRAVRYGYNNLNQHKPFLSSLVDTVIHGAKEFYPYLLENQDFIKKVITSEEKKFFHTLDDGVALLDKVINKLDSNLLPGDVAFKLYDTYGFPIELTKEIAKEKNIIVDEKGYEENLEAQRTRARNATAMSGGMEKQNPLFKTIDVKSEFIGYNKLSINTTINFITDLENELKKVTSGVSFVILDKCPFYAESGGQMADIGTINNCQVLDVQKIANGQNLIKLEVIEPLIVGQLVTVEVNEKERKKVTDNHSVTHLLHHVLALQIGQHVKQAGSFQDATKTRFDFTNLEGLTELEITNIEIAVNEMINDELDVRITEMEIDDAKELGANALFGEKYGDIVRVVIMGDSIELCGGTHVTNTKEIGSFHILTECGIGSGIRRIEAISGSLVNEYINHLSINISKELLIANMSIENKKVPSINELNMLILKFNKVIKYSMSEFDLVEKHNELLARIKILEMEKEVEQQNKKNELVQYLLQKEIEQNGIRTIDETIENYDIKDIKEIAKVLIHKITSGIVIIRVEKNNNVSIVVCVSEDLTKLHKAGDILKQIIEPFKGRGGGKPSMAQGGYSK